MYITLHIDTMVNLIIVEASYVQNFGQINHNRGIRLVIIQITKHMVTLYLVFTLARCHNGHFTAIDLSMARKDKCRKPL